MYFKISQIKKDNYTDFIQYLQYIGEEDYKNFVKSQTPDVNIIYGVKIPILRKLAKQMVKMSNIDEIKSLLLNGTSYEEKTLYCHIVGYTNYKLYADFLKDIKNFIPKINNWSINDTLACSIKKTAKKYKFEYFNYIKDNIFSDNPWQTRFCLVSLKSSFIEEQYIPEILDITTRIKSENYYVNMAIAWLISSCYIKEKSKVSTLLSTQKLQKWVQNKSIQKIIESTRVSKEDKNIIKSYKM